MFTNTYDARATSLPDGEMVADPTLRSTWIDTSASNVVLSNADLIIFPFLDSSIIVTVQLPNHPWAARLKTRTSAICEPQCELPQCIV